MVFEIGIFKSLQMHLRLRVDREDPRLMSSVVPGDWCFSAILQESRRSLEFV